MGRSEGSGKKDDLPDGNGDDERRGEHPGQGKQIVFVIYSLATTSHRWLKHNEYLYLLEGGTLEQ